MPEESCFKRPVLKPAKLREFDDAVVRFVHEFAGIPQHCAAKIRVFAHGQLRIEPGGELQKRGNLAMPLNGTPGRFHNAGHRFEKGGFARPVGADNPQQVSLFQLEGHVVDRHELFHFVLAGQMARDPLL
jgi:hypothetical protein